MRVATRQISRSEKELADLNKAIEGKKAFLINLSEKEGEIEILEKKIASLNEVYDSRKLELSLVVEDLKTTLTNKKTAYAQFVNKTSDINKLNILILDKNNEIALARKTLSELQEELSLTNKSNNKAELRLEEISSLIEACQNDISGLEETKQSSAREVEACALLIEKHKTNFDLQKKEAASILKKIYSDIDSATKKLNSIQKTIEESEKKLTTLNQTHLKQREQMESELQQHKKFIQEQREEVENARVENEFVKTQYFEKRASLLKVKQALEKETGRIIKVTI